MRPTTAALLLGLSAAAFSSVGSSCRSDDDVNLHGSAASGTSSESASSGASSEATGLGGFDTVSVYGAPPMATGSGGGDGGFGGSRGGSAGAGGMP
jgi:hypothetical protein